MVPSVEKQTTMSVPIIKVSLKFWWLSSGILMLGLICPVSGAKGAAGKNTPTMPLHRIQKERIYGSVAFLR